MMKKGISVVAMVIFVVASFLSVAAVSAAPAETAGAGSGVQTGTVGTPVTVQAQVSEPETASAEETTAEAQAQEPEATQEQSADSQPQTQESAAPGKTVIQWDDYAAQLLRYKVNRFEHSDAAMYLYMRVNNQTDRKMTLKLSDVKVDGVPVTGAGIYAIEPGTDTGQDSQEYCLLVPDPDNKEAGSDAIVNAQEVTAIMILKDSESQEELYRQDVTIRLAELDAQRNVWEQTSGQGADQASGTETSGASAQPAPAEQETTAAPAPNYRELVQGSRGEDVKALQQKLIELGYLDDKADGSYGPNTADAVKEFNEANGLTGGQTADAATQEKLFSEQAVPYTEPEIPLQIGSQFEVEPVQEDNAFFFRVQVANVSKTRTIRGYELKVYTTDVWDNRLSGEEPVAQTMTQKIAPGETVLSGSFYLDNLDTADTVWVGVSKVVFTDGEIRETESAVYYPCELPSRIQP